MRNQASKNILMKDGSVRRLPLDRCERLLASGQAKRFISNTLYRAVQLGIEVKNFGDRDVDGRLRGLVKDAREKAAAKKHKAAKKRKKEEETAAAESSE